MRGQALVPVVAIMTMFTVVLVLVAQSGLLRLVVAQVQEITR